MWYTYVTDQDSSVRFELEAQYSSGTVSPGVFSGSCNALLCLETLRDAHIFLAEAGVRYFILVPKDFSIITGSGGQPYNVLMTVSRCGQIFFY